MEYGDLITVTGGYYKGELFIFEGFDRSPLGYEIVSARHPRTGTLHTVLRARVVLLEPVQ